MLRLFRTIASLTIASCFLAMTASAGETGSPAQPETPAVAPATPPPAPPPLSQPQGSVPAPTPTAPSKGTPALVLDTDDYEGLLGKSVRAQNGDDLGRIIDVIIDRDGRPRAAIIDFGGFLGVGSRKIAVDWRVLSFTTEGKVGRITLALNRNQVRVSPEYKTGEPIVVLGAPGAGAPPAEGDQAAVPAAQDKSVPPAADKPAAKPEKAPDK